jgi:signal transduction histidine kinase
MARTSYEERLDEIRRAEFTSRLETVLRIGLVGVGAVAYFLMTGDKLILPWYAAHVTFELLVRLILTPGRRSTPKTIYIQFLPAYLMAGLTFGAYPLYVLWKAETVAVASAALAAVAGLFVYILYRRQRETGVLLTDAFQVVVVASCLVLAQLHHLTHWSEVVLVVACVGALAVYYVSALLLGMGKQAQLRSAQHRYANAQKARALNQFVGGVAHDFNNQLTAILGNLELFELLDDPKERTQVLEHCRAAAQRAALTVQQLLASSGRTRLAPVHLPLGSFLAGFQLLMSDLLDPGMAVVVEPREDDLTAWVDADMLETCLIQLCLNAQDATRGQGRIRIWADLQGSLPETDTKPESAPPYAVINVEDNGPGVSPEALQMLAEPFYSTKNLNEGSGLGLSAVAGFARQSGGTLIIRPGQRAGLRVALALPVDAVARRSTYPPTGTRNTVLRHGRKSGPSDEV